MTERFFIRTTEETRKALLHLAIDLNAPVEKLAGELMAEAVQRAQAEYKAGTRKPRPKPK